MPETISQRYDQDYRHFDTLIWQVPTWASAIFAFTLTAAGLIVANIAPIESRLSIDALRTLSVFLFVVFVILLLLANVLVRFRFHQGALSAPPSIYRPSWQLPGHTSLLLIVFIEAAALLALALTTAGASLQVANCISAFFLLAGFYSLERWVRRVVVELKAKNSST